MLWLLATPKAILAKSLWYFWAFDSQLASRLHRNLEHTDTTRFDLVKWREP